MKINGADQHWCDFPLKTEAWRYSQFLKYLPDVLPLAEEKAFASSELRIEKSGELELTTLRQKASTANVGELTLTVAAGVELVLRHSISGAPDGFIHSKLKLILEEGARVDHALRIQEGSGSMGVIELKSQLKKNSELKQTYLARGGAGLRLSLEAELLEEGAHAELSGLCLLTGKEVLDVHSSLVHRAANTTAQQLAKNLLDHESRAVFTGRVHIARGAQQVSAEQMSRSLMLSSKAQALSQPQLEIFADDVKCAHGSTTGQVGEEASFYLLSRGIPATRARELLTRAFVQEVLQKTQSKSYLAVAL